MSIQEVSRLREERNEAQLELERECRETFLPGMTIAYTTGRRQIIAEIVGEHDEFDYLCIVRNPKTGNEREIRYEDILLIVE